MMSSPDRPSRTLPRLSVAAVVVNVAIVVTGGIVRVTGSGLGCPDWPTCAGGEVLPRPGAEAGWHQAVEFGNRLMSFVVLAVVVWLYVELRRRRPADPARRWAGWLVVGVVGQGILGGITVRLELHPLIVATHFLASMVLIAVAVGVDHRVRERPHGPVVGGVPAGPALRRLALAIAVLGAVVLVLGTVVTASGPHAGDPGTPRLGLDIRTMVRLHAIAVWTTVAATVAGLVLARRHPAADRLRPAFAVLLVVEVGQGAVGYLQYALGIPAWLVALHLLGASLFWVAAVRVALLGQASVPSGAAPSGRPTPDALVATE
jgi:cytochrome c oxidase assembly protein subunit 15